MLRCESPRRLQCPEGAIWKRIAPHKWYRNLPCRMSGRQLLIYVALCEHDVVWQLQNLNLFIQYTRLPNVEPNGLLLMDISFLILWMNNCDIYDFMMFLWII